MLRQDVAGHCDCWNQAGEFVTAIELLRSVLQLARADRSGVLERGYQHLLDKGFRVAAPATSGRTIERSTQLGITPLSEFDSYVSMSSSGVWER